MIAILFRVAMLAVGAGAVEIGIVPAIATGSLIDWALVLVVGAPLIIAGSAGFIGPLLGGPVEKKGKRSA